MSHPTWTQREQRMTQIIHSLNRASEPTLHRIETELGLTPRPQSPDAGKPWQADQWTPEQLAEIRADRIEPNKITVTERIKP